MNAGSEITIYLICAVIAGGLAAFLAEQKGYSTIFWMPVSFIFPPFVLIMLFLPRRRALAKAVRPQRDPDSLRGEELDNRD
jgi:hypothetical protein